MKITFTFDSDEQRALALSAIPSLPDSNELDIDERFSRQLFVILRRFVSRTDLQAARAALLAKAEAKGA